MPLLVFLDETGDHSLELIDEGYPVFGVVMLICDAETYVQGILPRHLNNEGRAASRGFGPFCYSGAEGEGGLHISMEPK